MGIHVDADELKSRARLESIKSLSIDEIEDLLIAPAEAMIEEAFRLDLNTDGDPTYWEQIFDQYPRRRARFVQDYKRAIYLMINRMEVNPDGYGSQSVRGASVTFGKKIPEEVRAIMRKWGRPRRLYRC